MRARISLLAAAAVLYSAVLFAQDEEPWGKREALILTRVLAYDRNLERHAGRALVIAVLKRKLRSRESDERSIYEQLMGLSKLTVKGMSLQPLELEYVDPATLAADIVQDGIGALYIGPGLDANLGEIVRVTREQKVLSLASRPEYLSGGAAVGVFKEDGKPKIHVNLEASREEGAAFQQELLRLAKIIR